LNIIIYKSIISIPCGDDVAVMVISGVVYSWVCNIINYMGAEFSHQFFVHGIDTLNMSVNDKMM
jgi:hypothetical protein